jgi:hypothetical protein
MDPFFDPEVDMITDLCRRFAGGSSSNGMHCGNYGVLQALRTTNGALQPKVFCPTCSARLSGCISDVALRAYNLTASDLPVHEETPDTFACRVCGGWMHYLFDDERYEPLGECKECGKRFYNDQALNQWRNRGRSLPSLRQYELDNMDYRTGYLSSPEWRAIRERVLWIHDNRCVGCGHSDPSNDVHHAYGHYPKRGTEKPHDLIVLCRSCHQAVETVRAERKNAS